MLKKPGLAGLIWMMLIMAWPPGARAEAVCEAGVREHQVMANSVTDMSFWVNNTGTEPIALVVLERPSEHFSLTNIGISGWSVSSNSEKAELSGGTVAPGERFEFVFRVAAGDNEAPAAPWRVTAFAGEFTACGGDLGTAIVGVADVTAPGLSETTISGVTGTSVTVRWTSDEPADSRVDYGLTENYDLQVKKTEPVTEHGLTLEALTPDTTYYYTVCSTDESGNRACSGGDRVTTAVMTGGKSGNNLEVRLLEAQLAQCQTWLQKLLTWFGRWRFK